MCDESTELAEEDSAERQQLLLHRLHPEAISPEPALADNASCAGCCRRCVRMSAIKSMRELVITMPSLSIYANIGFSLKNIQHEARFVSLANGTKRPIALLLLICDAQFTEVLKSMAELQEKFGDTIYAEVKVTTTVKIGVTRLDVFCGRIDLAAQLRSNVLDEDTMTPVVLRIRLPHLVSGDCQHAKVTKVFDYLSTNIVSEMVRKAFDDE